MQRVHFIGIGEQAMLNTAIALSRKNNFSVSGSDDTFAGDAYYKLIENGLWPECQGWHPDRIHKGLTALITNDNISPKNPELIKAYELGLKVFSLVEYLYQQTRSKTRIVICGNLGVSTVTALILNVLKKVKMPADYLTNEAFSKTEPMAKLSYESRIAIFENIENINIPCRMFDKLKPHIGVLTGFSDKNTTNEVHTEAYISEFQKQIEKMEVQGRLIYFNGDEILKKKGTEIRRDIVAFNYDLPEYSIQNGITFLKSRKSEIPLQISGEINLLSLNAARLACRQIGIYDDQFLKAINDFTVNNDFHKKPIK